MNRGGKKLEPDIFALVTCADCYMFMPQNQFKIKPPLSLSENQSASLGFEGKKVMEHDKKSTNIGFSTSGSFYHGER